MIPALSIACFVLAAFFFGLGFANYKQAEKITNLEVQVKAYKSERVKLVEAADMYRNAENQWEISMMKLVGEDGIGSVAIKINQMRTVICRAITDLKPTECRSQYLTADVLKYLTEANDSLPEAAIEFPLKFKGPSDGK